MAKSNTSKFLQQLTKSTGVPILSHPGFIIYIIPIIISHNFGLPILLHCHTAILITVFCMQLKILLAFSLERKPMIRSVHLLQNILLYTILCKQHCFKMRILSFFHSVRSNSIPGFFKLDRRIC